ncbi:hypothetical protein MUCCIDRAFT_109233 [Mucor lusitanicus CBS 277.49]|uniref:Uncharacterized protein n=1 Tax=Mucor lusitanicus CBS 277.49 TaxID=747725 RepID=A0A162QSP8_MUCCL|nr:hypothetical protein MUCCIDRAFT_110912 [Mucor lusitanicus CBS 277.49]OAD05370.1 hypothetical protein MUCCIDRAFT_109233 [Mucor lusitanicus CBS 277.49]
MIMMPTPYNHYGARAFPTSGGFLTYAALRKSDAHTLQSLWRELYPTSDGFLTYAALR